MSKRTWQNVMDAMVPLKTGATQARWTSAMRDKAFDAIRHRELIETTSEHFMQVLVTPARSGRRHKAARTSTSQRKVAVREQAGRSGWRARQFLHQTVADQPQSHSKCLF
jgi:hypothetical protein